MALDLADDALDQKDGLDNLMSFVFGWFCIYLNL